MKNDIRWQYTDSNAVGHNLIDSASEIFKTGKWAFLTREVIQNSLDALDPNKGRLIVKMSLDNIETKILPDKDNIIRHLQGTLSISGIKDRCKKFCDAAIKTLNSNNIKILKVSDYNTKGVTGSTCKNDELNSKWNALIYDEGNSQKDSDNSTGSFGAGKNAPFALSGINTVFYSTLDIDSVYAFEGVSKLFTSYIDNKKVEEKIYYAKRNDDGTLSALNKKDAEEKVDKYFLREKTGTDLYILAIDYNEDQIKTEIIQAVVENFFWLLSEDKLEVEVFGQIIKKDNIWQIIDKYCEKPIEYTGNFIKYGYVKQYLEVLEKKSRS